MSRYLPLFPLNIVVYPGEKLNLHIFEPRYKQLVKDVLASGGTFGIPPFISNTVMEFGTELKILGIDKEHPNGEIDLRSKGTSIFRITDFDRTAPGKLYAGGTVEPVNELNDEDAVLKTELHLLLGQLHKALGISSLHYLPDNTLTTFQIAHQLGLNLEQEFMVLSLPRESLRQKYLLNHLKIILPIVEETEKLKERIKLNGHFKHLIPPQF